MSERKPRTETSTSANMLDAEPGSAAGDRERRSGGGVMKRLKPRRSQPERRPVTEDELRGLGRDITPDEVLGLRSVTRGRRMRKEKPLDLKSVSRSRGPGN